MQRRMKLQKVTLSKLKRIIFWLGSIANQHYTCRDARSGRLKTTYRKTASRKTVYRKTADRKTADR